MKVLVVDDSRVIRSILVRVLRSMGVRRIIEACDGEEAWVAFNAGEFQLVITDWHLGALSGLELTQKIRGVDTRVPIVMVTIVDTKAMIMQALEAGVSDYICKPFERDELESKLDKYVPVGE